MRIKGYSPSEAKDQSLQQQVRREMDKIQGEAIPGPPASTRRTSRYPATPPPRSAASSTTSYAAVKGLQVEVKGASHACQ